MDPLVDDFTRRVPAGLEQAYALWGRDFAAVARHVVSDRAAAEDCIHDALLRVWRSPNRFSGDRPLLRAYLMMCVRNEALSKLRSETRRSARELRAAQLTPAQSEEIAVADPVEAARLRAALGRLPPEQRIPLERAYYANKTHLEIARELDVPLGTIKSRIAMAMRKLQNELAASRGTAS